MPPVFSKFMDHASIITGIQSQEKAWPPPIPFKSKATFGKKKSDKSDGNDSADDNGKDSAHYIALDIKVDKSDRKLKTYREYAYKFAKGNPEDWVLYHRQMQALFTAEEITGDAMQQHALYMATFAGKAKEEFIRSWNEHQQANNKLDASDLDYLTDGHILQNTLNDVAKKFFENWKKCGTCSKELHAYLHLYWEPEPQKCH